MKGEACAFLPGDLNPVLLMSALALPRSVVVKRAEIGFDIDYPTWSRNSTGGFNSNDTEGAVLFSIGSRDFCPRTSAGAFWSDHVLEFRPLGWGPVVVKRYLSGEQLVWEYADGSVTRMDRICELPEDHSVPKPRGPRFAFFSRD